MQNKLYTEGYIIYNRSINVLVFECLDLTGYSWFKCNNAKIPSWKPKSIMINQRLVSVI